MLRQRRTERKRRPARDPRRAADAASEPPTIVPVTPVWRLDLAGQRLVRRGRERELTALQLRLLAHFVRRPDAMQTRAQLLAAVWGGDDGRTDHAVDQAICELRRLIEPDPARPRSLRTRRGVGSWYHPPQPRAQHARPRPFGPDSRRAQSLTGR